MPRTKRIVLPGYSHHVMQRGHNRQTVFKGKEDYLKFIDDMRELKSDCSIQVQAWSMTPYEVHLLVHPGDNTSALAEFMKGLTSRTTHYRNRLEQRSGTLWESRYRSSPVQPSWVLPCMRYIERVPLEDRIVQRLDQYRWSSYGVHAGLERPVWLDEALAYRTLGDTPQDRQRHFRVYMNRKPTRNEVRVIIDAVRSNQLTGDDTFAAEAQAATGILVPPNRKRGRPRKTGRKAR